MAGLGACHGTGELGVIEASGEAGKPLSRAAIAAAIFLQGRCGLGGRHTMTSRLWIRPRYDLGISGLASASSDRHMSPQEQSGKWILHLACAMLAGVSHLPIYPPLLDGYATANMEKN